MDEAFKTDNNRIPIEIIFVFLGCILVGALDCSAVFNRNFPNIRIPFILTLIFIYTIAFIYSFFIQKKRDSKYIYYFILCGAFLLRAVFVLETNYIPEFHDVKDFLGSGNESVGEGHYGLIEYLMNNHHLPDFDPREKWSFYNPVGFHLIAAVVMSVAYMLGGVEPFVFDSVQSLNLFFSMMILICLFRIFDECDIRECEKNLYGLVAAVFTFFMVFSVEGTSDMTCLFFMILAFLYTLKWEKNPSIKNILIIAFALGYAMFTKLNGGIICVAIGYIFLKKLWQNRADYKKYFAQYAGFMAICAPLGLYVPIKYHILYGLPIAYNPKLTIENDGHLYIGDVGLWDRFGIHIGEQLRYPFYRMNREVETNFWIQTVRSAVFDEIPYSDSKVVVNLGIFLLMVAIILFALLFFVSIYSFRKNLFLLLAMMVPFMFYIYFNLTQPFICTMSFRYTAFTFIMMLIGGAQYSSKGYYCKGGFVALVNIISVVFAVTSVTFSLILLIF